VLWRDDTRRNRGPAPAVIDIGAAIVTSAEAKAGIGQQPTEGHSRRSVQGSATAPVLWRLTSLVVGHSSSRVPQAPLQGLSASQKLSS